MDDRIKDFPKLKSPFVREVFIYKLKNNKHKVTPIIEKDYEWVFKEPGVKAVDKLHGTNVCCIFQDGVLHFVDNRKNRLMTSPHISTTMSPSDARILEGIINAIERKWISKDFTGRIYGELVGPSINCNLHNLDIHYFVPFDHLKEKCHWKSWISNAYPKTFESISEWFKTLPSLFTKRMTGKNGMAEGIVFYHPNGKWMAKLRRDMFDWYKEEG